MNQDTYVVHLELEVEGFRMVDSTATGDRGHDDLIWVGYAGGDGRWLAPQEALAVAKAIETVVAAHVSRHRNADQLTLERV